MLIFKVLTAEQWADAEAGHPVRAPVDIVDGYVHFSTAAQLQATLDKWFSGQSGCVLAAFEADEFGPELKWEKARGGDLFPHLYADVLAGEAVSIWLLDLGPNGAPLAPEEVLRLARSHPRDSSIA